MDTEFFTPDIAKANLRHDIEHGDPHAFNESRTRCGWNTAQMGCRTLLTDRQIVKYAKAGYYSAEFREARKKFNEKKQRKRQGNFTMEGGRLIYSPM